MIPLFSDPNKPIPRSIQRKANRVVIGFLAAVLVLFLFFCWLAF